MANENWVKHAYPLHQITVQLQGTCRSNRYAIIDQLEEVIARLKRGEQQGESHDDDFGYRFKVQSSATGPSFFEEPAADR